MRARPLQAPLRAPFHAGPRCCRPAGSGARGPGSFASRRHAPPPALPALRPSLTATTVQDNKGARRPAKRVGRGLAGGKGKTSGRGHKGAHARAAKSRPVPAFEGGQAGILRAIPKLGGPRNRGLTSKKNTETSKSLSAHTGKKNIAKLRLDALAHWIDAGRIDKFKPITIVELVRSRLVGSGARDGVTVLAHGVLPSFPHKIDLRVTHASQRAIELIESAGGTVTCYDYDRASIRALLKPEKYVGAPTPSSVRDKNVPVPPIQIAVSARYMDPLRRGYLANQAAKAFQQQFKLQSEQK
ncbi:YmL10 [Entophlyctis luteolus]|nr:YmL10 [Entophlyctis luteolus]